LYFAGFGRKTLNPLNSKIRTNSARILKSANSILERSESISILDLFAAEKRNWQNLLFFKRFQNEHVSIGLK